MVAISLYRGNLHRVPPDRPRQWPMPPHSISLRDFKRLTQKRSRALALARLPCPATTGDPAGESEEEEDEEGEEEEEEEAEEEEGSNPIVCPKPGAPHPTTPEAATDSNHPDPQGSASQPKIEEEHVKEAEPLQESNVGIDPPGGSTAPDEIHKDGAADGRVNIEVTDNLEIVSNNKVYRKTDLEKKLQVLNEKKHRLVQMLKQILNAEEEIKRRNIQSSGFRASIPLQPETAIDVGSVTRNAQKIGLELNFGADFGGEFDTAAIHNVHPRNLNPTHITSPTAAPLTKCTHGSLQHNVNLQSPRASAASVGHRQTAPNMTMDNATASPSRFALTGNQGHARSLPAATVSATHFTASTPSPAASGGASCVFRDPHMTSPS